MAYRLKSHGRAPAGGWMFREPGANWEMPLPLAKSFGSAVAAIAAVRQNHPNLHKSTDPGQIAVELDGYTCARLRNDPQWCVATGEDADKKKAPPSASPGKERSSPWQRLREGVAAGVATVRRTVDGARILDGWLGAGAPPVPPEQANARATVCAECPKNVRGDWKTMIQGEIAAGVLAQLRVKQQLELAVPNEHELGTCAVCLCHLPLKVHVPLAFITAHTSETVWRELPEWCWMRVEAKR